MTIDKSICPVPQDQRPINEYLALKEAFGFSWTVKNETNYYRTSFKIYFITLGIFVLTFNANNASIINVLVYSIFGVSSLLFIFYLRIYLGWNYVYTRLMQATVAYEESGWYDGQIWVKTPEILIKDKLAGQYQVKPILNKIKNTLFAFSFLIFVALYFISFF
uniref:Putative plastid protein 36 n=1 Tax=Storeatula sp. CCMP1868 TaxID=195070 RepID=A0A222AHV0_9CRYP|nr:putative plastid protein 36 [Storeatula sp. CCMP1868]